MSLNVFWFLPTHGDSRYLGTSKGARQVDFDYLKQVAVSADTLGYDGVLLPTGRSCEDAWVAASSLIGVTKQLKFLVAVRPGLSTPGLAVRMAATFDRLSKGRLLINVVTGGDQAELEADGLHASHSERYEITDEFLKVWRAPCLVRAVMQATISPASIYRSRARRPCTRRYKNHIRRCTSAARHQQRMNWLQNRWMST